MPDFSIKADIVDFHSHILPGADHGTSSVETSLGQLALASAAGVKRIIATPHFYPARHKVEDFIERRSAAWKRLSESLSSDLPDVRVGAEVLVCNGIENLPGLDNLFIHGTNTLLLELPFTDFQYQYAESAERLIEKGIEVVLAHADRYPEEHIAQMLEAGCKIQLNADAFSSLFVKPHIKKWLASGRVIALGSDIHHRDKNAYKLFLKAKKKVGLSIDLIKTESDRIWDASSVM